MAPKQRYTLPVMATLATLLSFSSITQADRVFLTKPTSNIDIYAGCPVDLGFRVQYSDLAMLKTVQLQVLGADSSILIDNLGYSSRIEWGDTLTRDIPWTVPADWTPGHYIVRAVGNATYPCVQNGHRARCSFVLEDRETVHLKTLDAGSQGCPITKTLISENIQSNDSTQSSEDQQKIAPSDPASTSSPQNNTDALSSSSDNAVALNSTGTEAGGTEGSSTQLHLILNQATLEGIQDQTIRKVLNATQDYNLLDTTVTLLNGTVIPMSDLMDNSTTTRFIQTLETTNATLTSSSSTNTNNSTGLPYTMGTAELVEALHKNTSLIQIPNSSNSNSTMSFTLDHNNTTTNPSGRQFAQEDSDQIQDKSKDASGNISAHSSGRLCVVAGLMLLAGSWVL
ncbi:hypothetical protein BGZ47_007213 [Haplosporangium gracile]|nr:hypothetical protein BGZ47_007213 [Haplosporangium gracile]